MSPTPEALGRAVHEAARQELVRQGWADHPWPIVGPPGEKYDWPESRGPCWVCTGPPEQRLGKVHHNHPDMVHWVSLPDERRAYFIALGEAGALAERRKWQERAVRLNGALVESFVTPTTHGVARAITRFLYGWDKQMNPDPLDHTEQRLYDALIAMVGKDG